MTKHEIVECLAKDKVVEAMVENIARCPMCADLEDLSQMVYIVLLEYREELIIDLWENKQMKFFIARVIINQFKSKTSPFYALIKKFSFKAEDITGKDWIYDE